MIIKEIVPKGLTLGQFNHHGGLGILPILSPEIPTLPAIVPLDEALSRGTARITEMNEAEVPHLLLDNSGEQPVLVLEGMELIGGNQNRIVNSTLIVLSQTIVKIPVSCIQSGRWSRQQDHFESGRAIFGAKSRSVQKQSVTSSLRNGGTHRSNQGAVWNEVSRSLDSLGVRSSTSNYREGRDRVGRRIEEFIDAIQPLPTQVGAVFFTPNGGNEKRVLGAEILGSPQLYSAFHRGIMSSFSIEALSAPSFIDSAVDNVREWWGKTLESGFTKHKSPGAGEDIRLDGEGLIGSGLVWNRLIHFSCFPSEKPVLRQSHQRTSRSSIKERLKSLRSTIADD